MALLLTKPFPEEFAFGHLGRIRSINGFPSNQYTIKALRQMLRKKGIETIHVSEVLAKTCDEDLLTYNQKYTISPLIHAVKSPNTYSGCSRERTIAIVEGSDPTRKSVFFCTDCASEQIQENGFSYWVRQHQLPGLQFCLKHKRPLYIITTKLPFEINPFACQKNAYAHLDHEVYLNHIHIGRYFEIMALLLERTKPTSKHLFLDALKFMLYANKHSNHYTTSLLASRKIIQDLFPRNWLNQQFGDLFNKNDEAYRYFFNHIHCQRGILISQIYCLMLATTFNTTTEAAAFVDFISS